MYWEFILSMSGVLIVVFYLFLETLSFSGVDFQFVVYQVSTGRRRVDLKQFRPKTGKHSQPLIFNFFTKSADGPRRVNLEQIR